MIQNRKESDVVGSAGRIGSAHHGDQVQGPDRLGWPVVGAAGMTQTQEKTLPRPIRVARIIDRLNVGGPAKHVVWLTAGLPHEKFESLLIAGRIAPGEGDMSYFATNAGVQPEVIPELSRSLTLQDIAVVAKLVSKLWRFRPDIVHTHKAKAGAAGRA